MPNIYGNYSLTEVAKEIGELPSFINRIQEATGIGKGEARGKGKQSSFSREDIRVFRKIKALRWMGFTFDEIKDIWNLENKMIKEAAPIEAARKMLFQGMIIHLNNLLDVPYEDIEGGDKVCPKPFKGYEKLIDEYSAIVKEISSRRQSFIKELETLNDEFKYFEQFGEKFVPMINKNTEK